MGSGSTAAFGQPSERGVGSGSIGARDDRKVCGRHTRSETCQEEEPKKEKRKQGLASEALSVFTDYAFFTLHLHQIYCHILSDNEDSLNLFRNHGFLQAGLKKDWIRKRNEWLDVVLLQKIAGQD